MRQTHHWAALVFVAAIVVHLCRIFFTGAFRRPREVNWIIGILLLFLALGEGFTGYSLPDDLLSGIGLRIFYAVTLAIPVIGTWVTYLLFGGEFPAPDIISRLFVFHIMLIPALLLALVGAHMAILVLQKHTQFPGHGRSERNVVGKRLWPEQTFKSVSLLLFTTAVLALLGGLAQINPVWQYGPFVAYNVSSPAQPDWYIGFLDGALRLGPPWDLTLWPWIERRFTKDRAEHHLLDRPRDTPVRTGIGAAGLMVFFIMFMEGGNDIFGVLLNVPVETVTRILQWSLLIAPILTFLVTYWICKSLSRTQLRPAHITAGVRLTRTHDGGYETVPLEPAEAEEKLEPEPAEP
jgi:ubiquinol-cytochrome c reductase cytochrome b subunit